MIVAIPVHDFFLDLSDLHLVVVKESVYLAKKNKLYLHIRLIREWRIRDFQKSQLRIT